MVAWLPATYLSDVKTSTFRAPSILLFDGSCAFCNRSVHFVLRNEHRHTLQFASLQSEFAQRILERRPDLRDSNSMIVADLDLKGEVESLHIRSSAGLRIAGYMGGWWSFFVVFWIIPRPIRDWIYNVIARHRHKLIRSDNCFQVPAESSHRFLDS